MRVWVVVFRFRNTFKKYSSKRHEGDCWGTYIPKVFYIQKTVKLYRRFVTSWCSHIQFKFTEKTNNSNIPGDSACNSYSALQFSQRPSVKAICILNYLSKFVVLPCLVKDEGRSMLNWTGLLAGPHQFCNSTLWHDVWTICELSYSGITERFTNCI
jgi:hypothetical protein